MKYEARRNTAQAKIISRINHLIRRISTRTHSLELKIRWKDNREIFLDRTLAFYTMRSNDISYHFERIAFNCGFIEKGNRVLELGYGDGLAGSLFYAPKASRYIGIDANQDAHQFACRNFTSENCEFKLDDFLINFPRGTFQNVIWDAGIGFFDSHERSAMLQNIAKCLYSEKADKCGIFSGFTIGKGIETYDTYRYTPSSATEIIGDFSLYFKNILVLERRYGDDLYFYFAATNGPLNAGNTLGNFTLHRN